MTSGHFIPAARFRVLTRAYDALCSAVGLGERLRTFELEHVHPVVNGTVLEVGCGTAKLLARVGQRHPAAKLIAADIDPRIVALARKRLVQDGLTAELVVASADRLPLPDESCDLVLSSLVLHHLPTDGSALRSENGGA